MTQENQQSTQEHTTAHFDTPQECCNQVATSKPCCKGKKACRYGLIAGLVIAVIALIIVLV
jgi:hypothetical protein